MTPRRSPKAIRDLLDAGRSRAPEPYVVETGEVGYRPPRKVTTKPLPGPPRRAPSNAEHDVYSAADGEPILRKGDNIAHAIRMVKRDYGGGTTYQGSMMVDQGDLYAKEIEDYRDHGAGENFKRTNTPWGKPNSIDDLGGGFKFVTTPSHEGLYIPPEKQSDWKSHQPDAWHGDWAEGNQEMMGALDRFWDDMDESRISEVFPDITSRDAVSGGSRLPDVGEADWKTVVSPFMMPDMTPPPVKDAKVRAPKQASEDVSMKEVRGSLPDGVSLRQSGYGPRYTR